MVARSTTHRSPRRQLDDVLQGLALATLQGGVLAFHHVLERDQPRHHFVGEWETGCPSRDIPPERPHLPVIA